MTPDLLWSPRERLLLLRRPESSGVKNRVSGDWVRLAARVMAHNWAAHRARVDFYGADVFLLAVHRPNNWKLSRDCSISHSLSSIKVWLNTPPFARDVFLLNLRQSRRLSVIELFGPKTLLFSEWNIVVSLGIYSGLLAGGAGMLSFFLCDFSVS